MILSLCLGEELKFGVPPSFLYPVNIGGDISIGDLFYFRECLNTLRVDCKDHFRQYHDAYFPGFYRVGSIGGNKHSGTYVYLERAYELTLNNVSEKYTTV